MHEKRSPSKTQSKMIPKWSLGVFFKGKLPDIKELANGREQRAWLSLEGDFGHTYIPVVKRYSTAEGSNPSWGEYIFPPMHYMISLLSHSSFFWKISISNWSS